MTVATEYALVDVIRLSIMMSPTLTALLLVNLGCAFVVAGELRQPTDHQVTFHSRGAPSGLPCTATPPLRTRRRSFPEVGSSSSPGGKYTASRCHQQLGSLTNNTSLPLYPSHFSRVY